MASVVALVEVLAKMIATKQVLGRDINPRSVVAGLFFRDAPPVTESLRRGHCPARAALELIENRTHALPEASVPPVK